MATDQLRVLLVIYDNGSYIGWLPQGMAAVAAVLREENCHVDIYQQDVEHYPDEYLTEYLNTTDQYDVVGISVIGGYWQYQRLIGLSKAIEKSAKRPPLFIIGGYGPTPEPKYFLLKTQADVIVMGEGESTTRELIRTYQNNESWNELSGIAYRTDDEVTVNPPRALIADINDINEVPMPAYDLFNMEHYRLLRLPCADRTEFVMPMLSGRGCTFKCNFCYRMDTGFRARSVEGILNEIEYLQENYNITYFIFSDDLLMINKPRIAEICEGFIAYQEKTGRKFKWDCNGRLNYATPEILQLMKRAGCVYINYGIEAFDNQILNNMKKGLSTDIIVKGIEATLKEELAIGFNIIWGNIGENKETLKKGVDFLLEYDNCSELRTIRPVTPYPGSPLYFEAINRGLIDKENPAADFYENKHLNSDLLAVNFTDLTDDEFYESLYDANAVLLKNYFDKQLNGYIEQSKQLYLKNNVKFRGFRPV